MAVWTGVGVTYVGELLGKLEVFGLLSSSMSGWIAEGMRNKLGF